MRLKVTWTIQTCDLHPILVTFIEIVGVVPNGKNSNRSITENNTHLIIESGICNQEEVLTATTITDNLIPEESLLDTTTMMAAANFNSNNVNKSNDEPSNAALLAGLENMSVDNTNHLLSTQNTNDNNERLN